MLIRANSQGCIFLQKCCGNSSYKTYFNTRIASVLFPPVPSTDLRTSWKRQGWYNHRFIDIEKSSLNPFIFASDGITQENTKVNKRFSWNVPKEYKEPYVSDKLL